MMLSIQKIYKMYIRTPGITGAYSILYYILVLVHDTIRRIVLLTTYYVLNIRWIPNITHTKKTI